MKCGIAFVLLAVLAVAVNSVPVELAGQQIAAQVTDVHKANSESITIDVTRDFIDTLGEETTLEVALNVEVVYGVLQLNGQPAQVGILSHLSLAAQLTMRNRFTRAQIGEPRMANVVVQVHVQASTSPNGARLLNMQETITQVDSTMITQIDVQQAVFEVDVNGFEISRSISHVALMQSRLASLATTTTTTTTTSTPLSLVPVGILPDENSNSDSHGSASDSDSDSDIGSDHSASHHQKICHRFAAWFHRQKLGVRIVLVAIAAIVFCILLNVLFCCMTSCFCPRKPQPTKRDVYLNNVKLHYVPVSMEDDDLAKKVTVA